MTEVELHIHIKINDKLTITPEKIKLLRSIQQKGSLLTASKELGISYNKAWTILNAINLTASKPVAEKLRGGKGGGGATLTEYGNLILKEFESLEKIVGTFAHKLNVEINL